jgi:hypothetical protein
MRDQIENVFHMGGVPREEEMKTNKKNYSNSLLELTQDMKALSTAEYLKYQSTLSESLSKINKDWDKERNKLEESKRSININLPIRQERYEQNRSRSGVLSSQLGNF